MLLKWCLGDNELEVHWGALENLLMASQLNEACGMHIHTKGEIRDIFIT